MRAFFVISLVALGLLVLAYSLLESSSGYILVAIAGYTIEMPFFVGVLLMLVFFALLYGFFNLLRWLFRARKNMALWAGDKRRQRGINRTTQGLVAFVEGRWDFARKSLERAASTSATPLVNYLFAARASSAIGDAHAVDGFLKKAALSTEGADVAIGLTQAELQIQNQQYEQALATLLRVKKKAHNHIVVLRLLARVYDELGDWRSLLKLLPDLRDGAIPQQELDTLEQYACQSLLDQAVSEGEDKLVKCWHGLPASAIQRPVIQAHYAERLIQCNAFAKAESFVRHQLQSLYDSDLVAIYGRTRAESLDRQLTFAQKLQKKHADDEMLPISLARISLGMGLPQQAKQYYEQSLAIKPSTTAYSELAELHASQSNYKESAALYAKSIALQD